MTLFAWPWAFFLVLPAGAALWWSLRRSARPAATYSSVALLGAGGRSFRQRLLWLLPALRAVAFLSLIVALARPQRGVGEVKVTAEGVAIMSVVDRSASMTLPMAFAGRRGDRLDVVRRVFREFIEGNGKDLKGREGDLIGLVTFARYADTVCPLVRTHDVLVKLVQQIAPADSQFEGGTAIGDGLSLAAARLKTAEEELAKRNKGVTEPDFVIKSKAIVLLTDGDENVGERSAAQAAELCKQWGIKIYAIGIGDETGGVVQTQQGLVRIPMGQGFNEEVLKSIASETGGFYWRAVDGESLRRIYSEIDKLEKTKIKSVEYTSYEEAFEPWALAGGTALALELLLAATLLRRSL